MVGLDCGIGDSADSSRNELRSVLARNQEDSLVGAFSYLHKSRVGGRPDVPLSKVVFNETTGSLSATQANANVSLITAYEYYFSIRTGGMVRTSDTNVNSNGNTTIKIDLKLTNPSGQTTDLGNTNINGGIGTRTHTIYLSVDQGVRVLGSYTLSIDITASVTVGGILEVNLSPIVLTTTFTVS